MCPCAFGAAETGTRHTDVPSDAPSSHDAKIHFPSADQSYGVTSRGLGAVRFRSLLPSAPTSTTDPHDSPLLEGVGDRLRNARIAPSSDHRGTSMSSVTSTTRSSPAISERRRSSCLPRRIVRYTTYMPLGGTSGYSASAPFGVIGSPLASTRPTMGSNGSDHNRVLSSRTVKASFVPSGEIAMFVSRPPPTVTRSGPSRHSIEFGSTPIRQMFTASSD